MVVLTGKNSLVSLFSLSKDGLKFFEKITKELNLEYRIDFNAFNEKDANVYIKFRDPDSRLKTYCTLYLTQKNFYLFAEKDINKKMIKFKETINDESNKSKLDEILEYLRYKMSVISDFLKFEKNLNIKKIILIYCSGFLKHERTYHNSIQINLDKKDLDKKDFGYAIELTNKFNKYEIYFIDCNIKDIKYIVDNYSMRENTKVLINSLNYLDKKQIYHPSSSFTELRKKILDYIDCDFNADIINRKEV